MLNTMGWKVHFVTKHLKSNKNSQNFYDTTFTRLKTLTLTRIIFEKSENNVTTIWTLN